MQKISRKKHAVPRNSVQNIKAMKNISLVFLFLTALTLSGCQAFNAQDAYNNALKKTQSGDNKEAVEAYNQAIKLHGDDNKQQTVNSPATTPAEKSSEPAYNKEAELYYNRAIAKSNLGDDVGAIIDYDKVIEMNPKDVEAYNNRAIAKSNI